MVLLEGGMKLLKNHKEALEAHANKLAQMNQPQLQELDADEINQVVKEMKKN
ncbi:hypothetical protein CTI12_AA547950 [Artemisia annua]|uniref:Uncharacterized protein n=1 Tax=Artemisia annua TaxID=35608 RepID=A0A2U1KZF8_ARTAN|nr:hypothetical protein CTI12_AA547950 [Artemisia annua]